LRYPFQTNARDWQEQAALISHYDSFSGGPVLVLLEFADDEGE
jgi:hypothetical protein